MNDVTAIMAYCPECMAEYREGIKECMDCGVPLIPGPPPSQSRGGGKHNGESGVKMVRLRTFTGPTALMEADLARNLLETEGIPCVLPGEFSAEMLPGIDVLHLLVRKEDYERAEEILQGYLDSSQESSSE